MEIFKLFGSILVDSEEANKSISNTDKNAEGLGKRFTDGIKTAAKWGAAIGAGALAAGGAMLAFATKAGNAADRLLDLNSITGMSTDEIQKWERVTKIAGVNTDAMTNASQKLTKTLDTMSSGTGKAAESAKALGFSYEDLIGMNADERMDAITQALTGVDDKTERAKLGTDLLGGSWKEIAPIVDLGAEAMQKAKDSADIISNEDLQKANNFRIAMDVMKDRVSYLAMELGVKLIPIAQKLFDWVESYMPQIQTAFNIAFTVIETVVTIAANAIDTYVMPILNTIFDWVQTNMPEIQTKFETVWQGIQSSTQLFVDIVQGLWNVFGDDIKEVVRIAFELIMKLIDNAFKIIEGLFEIFKGLFTGDWKTMNEGIKTLWSGLWDTIKKVVDGAWDLLKVAFDVLVKSITGVFINLGKLAFGWGKNMISGFIDGIKAMASKVTDAVSGVIGNVKGFLGFNSPAEKGEGRYIEDWGFNMIDGFLDGIKKAMPYINDTLNTAIPNFSDLNIATDILPINNITNNQSIQTANIIVELDSRAIIKAIKQPLVNEIRLATGLRI